MKRIFLAALLLSPCLHALTVDEALEAGKGWENKVYRHEVKATWVDDDHFWYRVQTGPKSYEFVSVDAATGKRRTGKDGGEIGLKQKMKSSESLEKEHVSTGGGSEVKVLFHNHLRSSVKMVWIDMDGKHHEYATVPPQGEFRQNTFSGHVWMVKDGEGNGVAVITAKPYDLEVEIDAVAPPFLADQTEKKKGRGVVSPDGKWSAYVDAGRVMLRLEKTGQATPVKMTGDVSKAVYGGITWAPDSSSLVFSSCVPPTKRKVVIVESSPKGQLQPKRLEFDYPKAGDPLPQPKPVIVHAKDTGHEVIEVESGLFANAFIQRNFLEVRWSPDGEEFYFDYNERGHQCYRILGVNRQTGAVRVVVEEKSPTFIDYTQKTWRHWLDKTGELLWMSERDGWCHLWLYDVATGKVKRQITQGKWVLRQVEYVDEEKRQVWFMASGLNAGEDPYHQHLCRVNLDGTGFIQLTQGDGQHGIEWSPNKKYFMNEWSRADQAPVAELRRSENGELICVLEKAEVGALLETGWQMPERFVAKGRDGKTDIHGVIIKPSFFDPKKSYPVVEQVYAGPHSAFSPKTFGVMRRHHEIAELGFLVVQADGLGTNHRGKVFHDVSWKNLKDAGFPDRMGWIKAAAKTRPWMDLSRVGIYGGSAGGQSAMRALLDHHDFYKVAVADCGCHDNRMDKIWWNEQWMGWPVDESYKINSNMEDAAKLQGRLLLIVGELDTNVDPASTYQVVHALQKAGKSFDFMPIMGTGHGAAETPFGSRIRMEFLARWLRP